MGKRHQVRKKNIEVTAGGAKILSAHEPILDGSEIVSVLFRQGQQQRHFEGKDLAIKKGMYVLAETDVCPEVGLVTCAPFRIVQTLEKLPKIFRIATEEEIAKYNENIQIEKDGEIFCKESIKELGLKMKLTQVNLLFDGSKIIFSYYASERVDFRELVKKLVARFKIRVEMRQIGIRHEAKMLGSIGLCGYETCCSAFLSNFDPISMKMAKAQNLPLNPAKISGRCGRLLCCLTYEYKSYIEEQGLHSEANHNEADEADKEEI